MFIHIASCSKSGGDCMIRAKKVRETVYKRLKDTIVREIKNKSLKPDDPILSERLLSEKFGISRISVRKALKELIDEGYLYTVPGKGTFVKGVSSSIRTRNEKTFNLGYIFWGGDRSIINIPYFAHIVAGAERTARKHDYHLLISNFEPAKNITNAVPTIIEQGKVDGAIIEGIFIDTYRELNKVMPTVIISNFLYRGEQSIERIDDVDYVAANNETAALRLMEYLYLLGHRDIGFIMGNPCHSSFRERLNGFYLGVEHFKMNTCPEWIVKNATHGSTAFKKIFNHRERPTGIVACNDFFAVEILEYCQKHGIKVPDEVSVVGFDDIDSAPWSQPPLTTVRVLTEEMGEKAAKRLIEKINEPDSMPTTTLIGTELVKRESCTQV